MLSGPAFPLVVLPGIGNPGSVLIIYLLLKLNQFIQQIQKAPGSFHSFIPGPLPLSHIVIVLVLLLKESGPGSTHIRLITGGILQYDIRIL